MREYGTVASRFWTRGSGRALRGNKNAQIVALYLMTCASATMIGIYSISVVTISHETGLGMGEVTEALEVLKGHDVAHYDEAEELVYLPAMAEHQIGMTLSSGDKRRSSVLSQLRAVRDHHFATMFVERYLGQYDLGEQAPVRKPHARKPEGASKGLPKKTEAPHDRSGSDQDQEQIKDPPNPQRGNPAQVSDQPTLPDLDPPARPRPAHGLLGTLAKAYGDGIREASGAPFVDPTASYDLRELKSACEAHCGAANTLEAQLWLRRSAAEYRRATAHEAKYQSGFSPKAWAKWLQAGKPEGEPPPPKEIKPPYHRPFPGLEPLPRRGIQ